jgi:hypothetical protein
MRQDRLAQRVKDAANRKSNDFRLNMAEAFMNKTNKKGEAKNASPVENGTQEQYYTLMHRYRS